MNVAASIGRVLSDSIAEPSSKDYGRHGDFSLVGHGKITNEHCGKHKSYFGCLNVKGHNRIGSDGLNHKGQVFVRKVLHSCDKPSCPICYKYGWATREAGKLEMRLLAASQQFGEIEHIMCSVPRRDYGLSYEELRVKVVKILESRGVHGGVLIFHAFRCTQRKHWYFSPHWHVLGFIRGGYKCRGCTKGCWNCDGFEGLVRRLRENDGYIVKVGEKRKTIGGTAWYQLNHASVKVGVVRFHVATWFGVCSYHKLKVFPEKRRRVCPICGEELVKLRFNGNMFVMNEHLSSNEHFFFDDAVDESGHKNWVVDTKRVW